ncbi:sugar phosphate isomerase/epimerase family protein [Paenibacillus hamazuiensis]|uniref:sugar phosphate isomerase/epimerase family protein n=1 Tax=Paenibacillus hamazuiensis TaxID=2936508 RepID=UPI00200DA574|nr:sugar phosphate isomerase/epimerase family protein [Paenibacillus hamazuiensis]
MAYGTLAHTVGCKPLAELTRTLASYDIDFVQLALSKAISDIDTGLGRLSHGLAHHIGEQFQRSGVRIGVLGCYIDPIHPDPAQRRREIDRFKEHLRFARQLGVPMVATETGDLHTYRQQYPGSYIDKGYEVLRETVLELAEEAEKWGVYAAIEPVCRHTLSSPERMMQLLEEIPCSCIGVVLDPCNLLDERNLDRQDEVIDQAFSLFGDRIVLAHIKGLVYQDGKLVETKPGESEFHLARFLKLLASCKPFIDISIESTQPHELNDTIRYLKQIAE